MLKTAKIEFKSSKFVVQCITYANEYLSIRLKIVKLGYLENFN